MYSYNPRCVLIVVNTRLRREKNEDRGERGEECELRGEREERGEERRERGKGRGEKGREGRRAEMNPE